MTVKSRLLEILEKEKGETLSGEKLAKEAISRMEGIRCGFKPTSCPDQLAKALKEALN